MTDSSKRYEFLNLGTVDAPYLPEIEDAVTRVLRSGRYIGGPQVEAFEQRLAKLCGATHAIGVSNGLDALRLILKAYVALGHMEKGDEIMVPANTFVASVLAIVDAGLTPVLVDPDPATSNLDTSSISKALTPRTRGIMPVHLYGRVCWDDTLRTLAKEHGLKIIEDNAQAIGAISHLPGLSGSHMTGALGDAAAFSFYPTKNIGAIGDAGAVTTSDPQLAAAVRALANYGSDTRYHNIYCGYNCRLDPVQAAILDVKLNHLEEENARRRKIAGIYGTRITNEAVRLPADGKEGCVWHQYVVHVADRNRFTTHLDRHNVGWDMHYATPPHMQPCFTGNGAEKLRIPSPLDITEMLASQCVSLPISACTSETDAKEISDIINAF